MSSSPNPKRAKEAENLLKKGDGACKKSFFHKPDFAEGGAIYAKAADIYMSEKMFVQAKCAFEQSAVAWDQAELQTKSGEFYANAAKAAYQGEELDEVVRLLREGTLRYQEGGQVLQAIRQLKDAALKIKTTHAEVACTLYEDLLEIVESEKQYHWEKDSFVDYAILRLKMKDENGSLKAWERAKTAFLVQDNGDNAAHCVVSAITIQLRRGEIVGAERMFNAAMQEDWFTKTDDFSMIDMMIRGVKNQDGDLIEIGQRNFILSFLKPEISRILMAFKAPKTVKEDDKEQPAARPAVPVARPEPEADDVGDADADAAEAEAEAGDTTKDDAPKNDEDEEWLL